MSKGVAPGCRRLHCDIPTELYEILKEKAAEPPAVSVAEYTRRLIALKFNYPLPRASERRALRLRVTGEPKMQTGPKRMDSVSAADVRAYYPDALHASKPDV